MAFAADAGAFSAWGAEDIGVAGVVVTLPKPAANPVPDELLAHMVHTAERVPEDVLRGPNSFGPAQSVADDADDTTKLMAWLGRETTN